MLRVYIIFVLCTCKNWSLERGVIAHLVSSFESSKRITVTNKVCFFLILDLYVLSLRWDMLHFTVFLVYSIYLGTRVRSGFDYSQHLLRERLLFKIYFLICEMFWELNAWTHGKYLGQCLALCKPSVLALSPRVIHAKHLCCLFYMFC